MNPYGAAVTERVAAARFGGETAGAAEQRTNPVCGDVLRFSVEVVDGRIARIRWKATGCPPTLAAADVVAELVEGETVAVARGLTSDEVIAHLPGLPTTSHHAVALALETLKAVLSKK